MQNNDSDRDDLLNTTDKNKEQIESPAADDNNLLPEDAIGEGVPDLDRDGFIGNTGGFYGGTSYLGSNYGPGWNNNENQTGGNYGAAGHSDHTDVSGNDKDSSRNSRNENKDL